MKIIPNTTLQDGRDYSPAGVEVDVDDDVARDLVDRGFAVLAPGTAFKTPKANAKRAASNTSQPSLDTGNAGQSSLDTGNAGNSGGDDNGSATGSQQADASQSGAQS
ncbi:hypothetical protein ACO0K0_02440 [Undibacterium sp. SXout11W]|uniref:hypothetical protein n=1 Tax=Undibacterium sp. SXout11W TaxID=3413050 RepID=UPI003BF41032